MGSLRKLPGVNSAIAPSEGVSAPAPASPELIARASALVRQFPECFWSWHPEARVRQRADVRLVVEHLREYGGWRAWRAAQDLHKCLSPRSRRSY